MTMTFDKTTFAVLLIASATWGTAQARDSGSADRWLPVGDGKVSDGPRRGYIFACETGFAAAGRLLPSVPWIRKGNWSPARKPVVRGEIRWPNASFNTSVEGSMRLLSGNGLPEHATGLFPVARNSLAFLYDPNPNAIGEAPFRIAFDASPVPASRPACLPPGPVGYALSGAAIFNAFDAAGNDAAAHEIQDGCAGHPQERGHYHYHHWSPCLGTNRSNKPVGYMRDGFPILPPIDASGYEWTTAELDDCHGMTGPVELDGRTVTMYHYRFTNDFPYTIGCWHGSPR
jgi:hypothetical protein